MGKVNIDRACSVHVTGTENFENLDVDDKVILKLILGKQGWGNEQD
jgi:hypothetical protein